MTKEERKLFWDTLCSLSGEDIKGESNKLCSVIKYPRLLYRYRSVNSNTLEALRTNTMFFSSSNYYDDPFDTFLHIDLDEIKRQIQSELADDTAMDAFLQKFNQGKFNIMRQSMGIDKTKIIDKEFMRNYFRSTVLSNMDFYWGNIRNIIKEDTWSVCFSENGFNESLWIKYANQHKGFSLIYDLYNQNNFICGKQEGCKNCRMNNLKLSLYPVYYSNEKYNATGFAQYIIGKKLEEKLGQPDLLNELIHIPQNQTWEREKSTLIKKECHCYDEEWRIITVDRPNSQLFIKWKPVAVILGLKMNKNDENLVISLAKQAGIHSIYKSFITNAGDLDADELR